MERIGDKMFNLADGKRKYIVGVTIALFLCGLTGIFFFQNSRTFAAPASNVGYVDFQALMSQHPDMAAAQQAMQGAVDQAKQDFATKSATMNDQEKNDYYNQLQKQLSVKQQELFNPINNKVIAAIKAVADAKGIILVVDKSAVIYGGQDITADVGKKITGQ